MVPLWLIASGLVIVHRHSWHIDLAGHSGRTSVVPSIADCNYPMVGTVTDEHQVEGMPSAVERQKKRPKLTDQREASLLEVAAAHQ